ncbi:MAG TPA: UDP-N-acetylglucosamine 1-carboxyvinyltransferase [Bacillota bacterium]|nr:UDP-N-acetylglucosamine 1-carboxyvinyltransferase [Bacillota bacterium]HPZ90169.1 UDP-N-acetylglucosamine 1-carboxyvinyltransferase [Bacillota bacterium]HQE01559.1 UDP-N-acetylglucosamine 1-carboxyvinyltransferase [Bacillota bacterium]
MEKIYIRGGNALKGTVKIDGAKNAALPVLAASLLTDGITAIEGVPPLNDVQTICMLLERLGAGVSWQGQGQLQIDASTLKTHETPYELVRKMRASILVMGPLLARLGRAKVLLPGGCNIGTRPIDLHLKGFMALGAEVIMGHGYIEAVAPRLTGGRIYLDFPSVGATENIMMAATLARGTTIIENAAAEPEIVDLANYLNAAGAQVRGAGTSLIRITGVDALKGTRHTVIPDRIEAGTFIAAAAITGGQVLIKNALADHLKPVIAKFEEVGVKILEREDGMLVIGSDSLSATDIKTLPYPGFPTDMQAQAMAVLTIARGTSVITETIFENRFMHVDELKRMNARIKIEGRSAVIEGVPALTGAPVNATDLRAGAALVLAGLAAEGITEVGNVYHIDRGYHNLVGKLKNLGADIWIR